MELGRSGGTNDRFCYAVSRESNTMKTNLQAFRGEGGGTAKTLSRTKAPRVKITVGVAECSKDLG